MITVGIVEDNDSLREGLQIALADNHSEFSCVGAWPDAESAMNSIINLKPDVVLMDINLPGMTGIDCLKKIKEKRPQQDVLILTVFGDDETVFDSLCADASGYITKNASLTEILNAIRDVKNGGAPMSGRIARMVVKSFATGRPSELTEREKEVLDQLCKGKSYKMIADSLQISIDTVRHHIKNIYKKLEVHSLSEAILTAMKRKFL